MHWNLAEEDYPQIDIEQDHILGLSMWLEKISELARVFGGEWNTLVADIWPNEGYTRLIGHVQMNHVAIGYDTGFRVCAYLKNGGIQAYSGDDTPLIEEWLKAALARQNTHSVLSELLRNNQFDLRLTQEGYGKLSDAIHIPLKLSRTDNS